MQWRASRRLSAKVQGDHQGPYERQESHSQHVVTRKYSTKPCKQKNNRAASTYCHGFLLTSFSQVLTLVQAAHSYSSPGPARNFHSRIVLKICLSTEGQKPSAGSKQEFLRSCGRKPGHVIFPKDQIITLHSLFLVCRRVKQGQAMFVSRKHPVGLLAKDSTRKG